MSYNVEYKLENNQVVQLSSFISRTQDLVIKLKTSKNNIQNIKILLNNQEYYMLKSERYAYSVQLYRNMVKVGNNTIQFVIDIQNRPSIITNTLNITLTKENIIQTDFDYVNFLISTLNKIIINMNREWVYYDFN